MLITHTTIGLAGEHLVASSILQLGYGVAMCQQDKIDLVAFDNYGAFFTIQVKSARIYKQRHHSRGYQFQLGSGSKTKRRPSPIDFDIMAFSALDQRAVFYQACCSINQTTKRFKPEFFENRDIEADSWSKSLEIVRERRNGLV
mgnify:CR=1 FL=1